MKYIILFGFSSLCLSNKKEPVSAYASSGSSQGIKLFHDEDRPLRMLHDMVADAAEHEFLESAQPAAADHDQIAAELLGFCDDRLSRRTLQQLHLRPIAKQRHLLLRIVLRLLGILVQLFIRLDSRRRIRGSDKILRELEYMHNAKLRFRIVLRQADGMAQSLLRWLRSVISDKNPIEYHTFHHAFFIVNAM